MNAGDAVAHCPLFARSCLPKVTEGFFIGAESCHNFAATMTSVVEASDSGMVWELFVSPDALMGEMTAAIESRVKVA